MSKKSTRYAYIIHIYKILPFLFQRGAINQFSRFACSAGAHVTSEQFRTA